VTRRFTIILALVLVGLASTVAWAIVVIEATKLNTTIVLGPPLIALSATKLNTYPVVGPPLTALSATKFNTYVVVNPGILRVSKLNTYIVGTVSFGGIIIRAPLTHW
jgi:hypothetical protein